MLKRVDIVEFPLGNCILGQMIVPQLEKGRHYVEAKRIFFIENNVYLLIR
nr:hypothetical protein [Saccharolobus caldissimus]